MTSTNTISGKSMNRLRQQLVELQLGRLPDVGEKHAKGYRFAIGKLASGGLARFWLGQNEGEARRRAAAYVYVWADIVTDGGTHWTELRLEEARQLAEQELSIASRLTKMLRRDVAKATSVATQLQGSADRISTGPALAPAEPVATEKALYNAIDAYLSAFNAKRHSDAHKWRAEQIVRTTLKRVREDCPLSQIDYLWLDRLCDYFKARPASLKNGQPISPETVATTLRYLRAFFVWVDDSGYGGWEGPRKLARPFRVRKEALMNPAELKDAATIKQFDLPTLRKLYSAATDTQKVLMLTALFTGGTQTELAVLERREFDLTAGTLTHFRNKTHIEGRFWLPPELVKLLRAEFKSRPGDTLAFRTEDGNPLVSFNGTKKVSDAVRLSWDRLRVRAEVPDALSFKYLRKYLADWMTRKGGETMGQIALSHARQSVLAKNYTTARDFDGFNRLQQEMYAEMKAGKFFEKLTEEEIEAARQGAEQEKPKRKGKQKAA